MCRDGYSIGQAALAQQRHCKKDKEGLCLVAIITGTFQNLLRRQTGTETTGHIPKTESQTGNPAQCKWYKPVMSKRFLKEN